MTTMTQPELKELTASQLAAELHRRATAVDVRACCLATCVVDLDHAQGEVSEQVDSLNRALTIVTRRFSESADAFRAARARVGLNLDAGAVDADADVIWPELKRFTDIVRNAHAILNDCVRYRRIMGR